MSRSPARNLVRIEGIGLHSGQKVAATLAPAAANRGITINGKPALLKNVTSTSRATTIGGVVLVEHLLSAAYGLGVYDLAVTVEGSELPALDGSALPWVEALEETGVTSSSSRSSNHLTIKQPNHLSVKQSIHLSGDNGSIEAYPFDGFEVEFVVNFKWAGEQKFVYNAQKMNYKTEIAPARTFGYLEEIDALKQQGLGLGASFDNALVLTEAGYANEPRFPDELVRHKVLDLIGDLALLGRPLNARIVANCSGHKLNAELTRRILEQWK
jgi:UDP-3-O-[3-hydroxymyristoyl] N-acetylglucosamine deacetylase